MSGLFFICFIEFLVGGSEWLGRSAFPTRLISGEIFTLRLLAYHLYSSHPNRKNLRPI